MTSDLNLTLSNPDWTRDVVVAHFGGEGPHAEIYKVLRAQNERDFFLNVGYSRKGQRHWGSKAPFRLVDRLAKRLLKLTDLEPNLLDIGSGRGGPAFRAHDRWGMQVTGLDLCESNVDEARRRVRIREIHEGLLFSRGNGENLPFSSGSFSLAWSIESAGYMQNKRNFFREAHRVLEDGGAFAMAAVMMNEHTATNSKENLDRYGAFLQAWDFPHLGTPASYEDYLKEAGFELKRLEIATARTLDPHLKRLARVMRLWNSRTLYRISKWYIRRKTDADLDPIREQLTATYEALEADVLEYGLFWAAKG